MARKSGMAAGGWMVLVVSLGLTLGVRAEEPERGFFGLTPVAVAGHVEVRAVTPGGPAAEAGVRPGDVILTLDGNPVSGASPEELFRVFTAYQVGETVAIVLRREGEVRTVEVTLGTVPRMSREDQKRVEEVQRKIEASRSVEEIFQTYDELELSLGEDGELRLRGSGRSAWRVLEPQVAKTFEPIVERSLRSGERSSIKLRIERDDDGSLSLVPVD